VGYDSNSTEIIKLLLAIAEDHPKIIADPAPVAFFLNFGEFCLNFELKFWLDDINI
jgi:small-conductance mechanosensitive channel